MSATSKFDREKRLTALAELARQRLAPTEAELAQIFLGAYFHRVPSDDLARLNPEALYASALSHLDLARQRQPGQPLLRAYNPTETQAGGTNPHTVVEAVVDDMAFLVDSASMVLNRLGYTIHLTIHPVLDVSRDNNGNLIALNHRSADARHESFLCFHISRESRGERLDTIIYELTRVLSEVSAANTDDMAMGELALSLAHNLDSAHMPGDDETRSEAAALCRWIAQENFTFLGAVRYEKSSDNDDLLSPKATSALGILRPRDGLDLIERLSVLPESTAADLKDTDPVMITK